MSKSLLSKKSSLTSRRNVIIYIIATILILGIVAGFTNVFHTDNRRFAASWGETIVMESQPPATGSPSDFDLLTNLQYTAYKIHHSKYFKGYTDGKVSADIGIGSYTQYLTNTRVVYNQNIVFTETISSSSLKSLAEQKYADNGVIIYRGADKIDGNKATFSKTASQMSYEQYSKNYGTVPNQLSKYIINEKTILAVKDENASVAPRLNGNDSDDYNDVGFDVPDRLVPNADGNYVFTLTLDPTESSLYYRNEVRTLGGADQNPKFYAVKVTVTVNSEWIPLSTRTLEEYDIEIPVLGAMRCSGDNFETFSMIDDENGTIPEKDFFQPYVDQAKANPDYKPPEIIQTGPLSASDYLASAFECYLSGEKNLDLTADIYVNGIPVIDRLSAYDLALSVNLGTLDIQAMLGSGLYVKYAGDKVYIKNKNINGYVSTDEAAKLADDPILKGLLSFGTLDMNKIFGGDMLDVIFKDCEMTEEDGVTEIPMSFSLDLSDVIPALDEVKIVASIKINTADKSLNGITGTVTLGDVTVDIEALPLKASPEFPSVDGAKDLSGLLDFVPDIAATAVQNTYGIDGTLTFNDMTIGLSAYVDRTDKLTAEVTLNVLGLDVLVKYIDETIYATALGVDVRGTAEQLPTLLDALLDGTDFDKYKKLLKALLPLSVNQIVDMLDTVAVNDNSLEIGLSFMGMPINAKLTRAGGKLKSVALGVNVNLFGIKANVAADLNITEPTRRQVTAPTTTGALTFDDLATLIKQAKPYLDADYYTVEIDGHAEIDGTPKKISGSLAIDKLTDKNKNVIGVAADGSLCAIGQDIAVTYVDGTAYVAVGNIKAKLAVADINGLMSSVMQLVGAITGNYELPEVDITAMSGAIKSLTMTDGTLNAALDVEGCDITVSLNLQSGKINVAATVNGINISLNATVATAQKSHGITAPTDADKYLNANELATLISASAQLAQAGGVTVPVFVTYGDKTYSAEIKADFGGDVIGARITVGALGLDITLIGDAVYVSMGEIKLCGTLDQAKQLYAEINAHYPLPPIGDLLQAMSQNVDIQGLIAAALDSVVSLTSGNGTIYAQIAVDGINADIALKSDLSEISANTTVNGIAITIAMTTQFGCEQITAPSGDFNSISELNGMLPAVFALADSKAFEIALSLSTSYGDGYSVNGNAVIDITDGVKASAKLYAFGQTVNLTYADDVVYLGLQALRFKLSPAQMTSAMPKVTALLGALGIALPDIGDMADELKNNIDVDTIENAITTGIAAVKSFTMSNGVIAVTVEYEGYAVTLDIDCSAQNGVKVTVSATAKGTDIALNLTLAPTDQTVAVPDGEYSDVSELMSMLDVAAEILDKGGIHTVATVTIGDVTLNAAIDCTIEDGTLKAVVKENTLGLTVVLIGDTAYIEVGGIKVSGQLSDITAIMDAVIPNLPDVIRPYVQKMQQQILGIVPSGDELNTDGKTDIAKTIDTVLAMLTSLSVDGEQINIGISRGALAATLGIATDLSCIRGDVTLTFNGIGGPFGEHYQMAFGIGLQRITASNVTVPSVNPDEYVKASTILDALNCILPLMKQNAFDLGISATVFGQTVTGSVYIDLGEYSLDTIAAKVQLYVAGMPITVTLTEKTLYLDINDGSVRLTQPLSKAAIKDLLAQIDEAAELGLSDKVTELLDSFNKDIAISDILDKITLSPAQNGIMLAATFGNATVNANIVIADGVLSAIDLDCNIGGKQVTVALAVQTAGGVLSGLQATQATILGVELGLDITLSPAESKREITPDGEYIAVSEFIPYISPVKALIDKATSANTLTIDLSDMIIEVMGKQITVSGTVDMSLNPIAVRAVLTLFADSNDDKIDLTVVYADSVLYIDIGRISLKFDTKKDMSKLNEAIAPYLPKSLKKLGDLGALSPIFAVIDNIKKIAAAQDVADIMSILFDNDNAFNKSTVQLVADMVRLFKRGTDGSLAAGITVLETPFDVTVNVQPIIDNGYLDFKLGVAVSNLFAVNLTAKLSFADEQFTVSAPENADGYTPVVDFVTTVINGVNTITAKVPDEINTDSDGNTTTISQTAFEVDSFAFDYDIFKTVTKIDENGETVEVKDDAGRPQIAKDDAGNKIKEKTIQISNIDGQKALRFGLTTTKVKSANGKETKSTKLAIEAHIRLGIIGADGKAQLGFPIELDLYVQPLDTDEKGLAYLYYKEANGYGEKISIDYVSVLQMVAAVLDILSVDDATVESLLGNYRLDIDKTVFESMAIAGLDKITDLLNNLIKAIDEAKAALSDAKAAWNRIQDAEDLDALIYEALNDTTKNGENATVKAYLDSAISHLKAAIALFKTDEEQTETPEEPDNKLNGALVGKVVNSVYFRSADSKLSAYVDNAVATGTDGWAVVSVTSENDKVNDIGVTNLDVNTAKLNTFDMSFAPTQNVTVTVPDDYKSEVTDNDKVRYADLANLKHLIFDVMNTANMLEFDIGGLNTSDAIKVHMKLGADWLANLQLNIKYNAKVKIIKTGEDKNGKPIYQTAAAVEIHNEKSQLEILGIGSKVIVPDCTTRLFFYDDVIYIQGVRSWKTDKVERVAGTVTDIYCIADVWGTKQTRYPKVNSTEYVASTTYNMDYVEVMYTVDELFWMIGNDMNKFLNEFLFYLIPITTEKIAGQDIRGLITDNIGNSSSTTVNEQNTIAQIFKEYAYADGEHTLRIGLKELAGSSALSDLTVKIKGANDGDDNVLDNYISSLSVNTSIANIITVDLNATLNNVAVAADGSNIYSKGLAPTNVTLENGKYSLNGANYVYDCYNYDRNTIYTLDGLTYFTANGNNLYIENGSFAPALRRTNSSDLVTWTSTTNESRYCDTVYKFGDTGATYYYTATLNGYGYRYDGNDTYYIGTGGNGNKYVYRIENGNHIRVEVKSIATSLLAEVTHDAQGNITAVTNRNGGIQWAHPWQADYEASLAA